MDQKSLYIQKEYYSDSPFTKEELEELSSGFLPSSRIWELTKKRIGQDWWRVWLKPELWALLVVFVSTIIYFIIFFALTIIFPLISSFSDNSESSSLLIALIGLGIVLFLIVFSILFFALFFYIIGNIAVRKNLLFNRVSEQGIFTIKEKIASRFWNLFLFAVVVYLILLIPSLVIGVISVIGSLIPLIGPIIEFIATLLNVLLVLILFSFVGYAPFLIIFEKGQGIESMRISWEMVKPYFWLNVKRWIILGIFVYLPGILISLFSAMIRVVLWGTSLSNPDSGSTLFEGVSNNALWEGAFLLIILYAFSSLIYIIYALIINLFYSFFNYVSFMNLRMMSLSSNQKNNLIRQLESETTTQ